MKSHKGLSNYDVQKCECGEELVEVVNYGDDMRELSIYMRYTPGRFRRAWRAFFHNYTPTVVLTDKMAESVAEMLTAPYSQGTSIELEGTLPKDYTTFKKEY